MSDITNQSLKEIIENIKTKKISSLDLTRSYIKNIEGAKKLNTLTVKFDLQAGEDDKLFGSVTSTMICDAIDQEGYKIDKKEIQLDEPIKHLGKHDVEIHLGQDLSASIKVKVSAIEE